VKVERVRQMGLDELMYRSRQEASKWLDRTTPPQWRAPRPRNTFGLAHFRSVGPSRFFAGAVSTETPRAIATRMPSVQAEWIAEAEALLETRFDLLGYHALDFGDPVDWQLDPIAGRRAPMVHWSRLNPLAFSLVGDSKVVWELNRHQWMVRLGQAYRATRDERYANVWARHLRQWIEANPRERGINWASSLEVSYRLIAWCWCLFLFDESPALTPELFESLLGQISSHAQHIERYLSLYFSPNTHFTGEALGLFYAGLIFQELPHSSRWLKLGTQILTEESEHQILPDGVYFERATGYQRYTLEIYLHFLILAARNGLRLPSSVAQRTETMVDFVLGLRLPDGAIPQIGDADSGSLLPFERRSQSDFKGVLSTAAVVFGRADCAWASRGATSDLLWLLGAEALCTFESLRPTPPAGSASRVFRDGGFVVMRSNWQSDGQMLIYDTGPLGAGGAGHGHADLLSIQCAAFGEPFVVDAGTFCYTADPQARDFFRGTASHSTVLVDGNSQSVAAGPFRWSACPQARLRLWQSTPEIDFADAEHAAYGRPPDSIVHRRRILYVKPRFWVIADDLEGSGHHRVDLCFQLAPADVQFSGELCVHIRGRTGNGLMLHPFSTHRITANVHCGEIDPMLGWISHEYGQRQPAPLVRFTYNARFPSRSVTLVMPVRQGNRCPVVSPVIGSDGEPIGLMFDETGERIQFDE
jgi:heparinase II/III-like protein